MLLEAIPKTYLISEVAEALNIDRETVLNMSKRGDIKIIKLGGRLRVLESSLETYLKEIGLIEGNGVKENE